MGKGSNPPSALVGFATKIISWLTMYMRKQWLGCSKRDDCTRGSTDVMFFTDKHEAHVIGGSWNVINMSAVSKNI